MNNLKILLVEDSDSDIESYRSTEKIYQRTKDIAIETVYAQTVADAINKIDSTFDGAIVDLKLEKAGNEGNEVIAEITSKFRIPIIIFTGTPDNVDSEFKPIEVYKKGEQTYEQLLNILFEIHSTGLTRIMGGRGKIENFMNKIFWKNLIPTISSWKKLSKEQNTEEALLRYTISHLQELLYSNSAYIYPEETYIFPPMTEDVKPGSIVFDHQGEPFLVLSPACDLAVRDDGQIKTDRILVSHIEKFDERFKKLIRDSRIEPKSPEENEKKYNADLNLNKIIRNSMHIYYHYLPKSDYFDGGLINFRKINTYKFSDFEKNFSPPHIQISSHFIKEIIGRFSNFYSRQGQPDFDFDSLMKNLTNNT